VRYSDPGGAPWKLDCFMAVSVWMYLNPVGKILNKCESAPPKKKNITTIPWFVSTKYLNELIFMFTLSGTPTLQLEFALLPVYAPPSSLAHGTPHAAVAVLSLKYSK
jgi:hypothetical protein